MSIAGGAGLQACIRGPDIEAPSAVEVLCDNPIPRNRRWRYLFHHCLYWEKKCLLPSERMANLFVDVLFHDQNQSKYRLHEFVVIPNHFHTLITPLSPVTLEKAAQFTQGAFSFRAKKELGLTGEIWQTSFCDHRVAGCQ